MVSEIPTNALCIWFHPTEEVGRFTDHPRVNVTLNASAPTFTRRQGRWSKPIIDAHHSRLRGRGGGRVSDLALSATHPPHCLFPFFFGSLAFFINPFINPLILCLSCQPREHIWSLRRRLALSSARARLSSPPAFRSTSAQYKLYSNLFEGRCTGDFFLLLNYYYFVLIFGSSFILTFARALAAQICFCLKQKWKRN